MGFFPLDLAVHFYVCWFLYVSFYLVGESFPFSFWNRTKISTKGLRLNEILSKEKWWLFRVIPSASIGLKFLAHRRINPLWNCLPLYWWTEEKEGKGSPTDGLLGFRSGQNGTWFEYYHKNIRFSHKARTYCTQNKTTFRKVSLMIFSNRLWLSFIAFDGYNKY